MIAQLVHGFEKYLCDETNHRVMVKRIKRQRTTLTAIVFIGLSMLISCGRSNRLNDEDGEEISTTFISLTNRQMQVIGLQWTNLKQEIIPVTINISGQLKLAPQDRADVSPLLGGVIKKIHVFEGDHVRKGEVLAALEHPDYVIIQQTYQSQLAQLAFLQQDYNRQSKLHQANVGSIKQYEQVKSSYMITKANVNALQLKLGMLGLSASQVAKGRIFTTINLLAPISGTVSLVETNLGAYIASAEKIFEIVDNRKIHADIIVYQSDFAKVKTGQKVQFFTSGVDNPQFNAKIHAISPNVEMSKSGIHLHAEIEKNNANLIDGMYIKGEIIVDEINALVLPENAVVSDDGLSYIFVASDQKEGSKDATTVFRKTQVMTGVKSDGKIEIKLLSPHDHQTRIVGYGAYYLLAEMGKSEVEDDD